jgi:Transcriptional regulator
MAAAERNGHTEAMAEPPTERGRETRDAILACAARLFHQRGVKATSVEDVLAAAGAGKGQFYRYFASKSELVGAVVDHQVDRYLTPQRNALERLEDWSDLERYLTDLADRHEQRRFAGGCPLGSLAVELSGRDENLHAQLAEALAEWQASLTAGLRRLSRSGHIREDAPLERLATATLASIQGAYLLATVHADREVMDDALAETVGNLRRHAPIGDDPTRNDTA